ncbi:Putative aliphatic sulfonates transport permease protein SsuC [Aquimixticola soesokkakensis]|uniref:Putative aliphatic sulfonates transport permease protein SsuC n=1 Tax=Aquimixticola soesokkakensis TaxID=1519096 RepID=A0A1Y5S050_9RHOB|nr:ABC transporter permease [Aquimixticola soesokkakensis]SLN26618.1 Putative aliphatic sulfonates transport permease protein SsuC [Aquimixticola soesokkakensis]
MLARCLPALVLAALVLAVWEVSCAALALSPLILPPPSGVATALFVNRSEIARHAVATLMVAGLGFSLSIGFAWVTSVALYFAPLARRALMPLFVVSQTVPLVALAPLMILWFGFGLLPKVLLVILVTFFPILLSLLSGYRQTPPAFVDLLVSMGASRWTVFWRACLPAARAACLAGLRISATYAFVATIFAEYAGARRGLGIYILMAKNNFRADLVLAAVALSALLTLALLGLIHLVDRASQRGPQERRDA